MADPQVQEMAVPADYGSRWKAFPPFSLAPTMFRAARRPMTRMTLEN